MASFDGADGAHPYSYGGSLIIDSAGDLFGTTFGGGTNGDGALFEIVKTGAGYASAPTILASFGGANGGNPGGGLFADAAGDLFGTTTAGGTGGDGSVFEAPNDGFYATSAPVP